MKLICLNVLTFVALSGVALRAQNSAGDQGLLASAGSLRPIVKIAEASQTAVPPQPPKRMAADADPSFEVATIRLSDPAATGRGFRIGGRKFSVLSTSVSVLMQWAYGVQAKQIVGAPDWLDNDKYDITGVPDREGQPSSAQWKTMVQKLLADRFKLTFHHDQRVLPVYALSVGKAGSKLTKSESGGPLISFSFETAAGGISLPEKNATMAEFASVFRPGCWTGRWWTRPGLKADTTSF
jgi:uncharacterized protein (TIGR03435 family)